MPGPALRGGYRLSQFFLLDFPLISLTLEAGMTTAETIDAMNERSYAEISSLLSSGNVTLQSGGILSEGDFDKLMSEALDSELGDN